MPRRGWPAWARVSDILDLIRLSGPIAISRMSMMLMAVTDAVVLGQNAPAELPYVLNAWLPIGISLGLGMGVLLGIQVLTSELAGRGQAEESGRIFRRGIVTALVLGTGLMLLIYPLAGPLFDWILVGAAPAGEPAEGGLPAAEIAASTASVTRILALGLIGHMLTAACSYYLEAMRRPLLVTVTMYGGVLVNLILDLALVAGWWGMPKMGAEGVAWATTGTRWLLVLLFAVMVLRFTPALAASAPAPAGEARRQLSVGTGTAISNVAEWGGFNFTYIIATWISLATNVVYGYSTQVMAVAFMFYLGLGTATSVRVAEAMGRGDPGGVRDAGRLGVVATLLLGTLIGIIVYLLREPIAAGLVNREAELEGVMLMPALVSLLWIVAAASVFDGLQATASMALRAQGVVWLPSLIHIGSFFAFMIPAGILLGLQMQRGAQGMLEAAFLGVFVAALLQILALEWKTARREHQRAVSISPAP